jgi:hypothetical protein
VPSVSKKWAEYEKHCKHCNERLAIRSIRDVERKAFCSFACKSEFQKTQPPPVRRPYAVAKCCEGCGIDFLATDKLQRFCTTKCQAKTGAKRHAERTNTFDGHLKRLLVYKGRKQLSLPMLQEMFKRQNGLCALSGVPMTWGANEGRVPTHVSIDRIDSNKGYDENNVHLVCRIVNIMKNNLTVNEFVGWCKLVEANNAF